MDAEFHEMLSLSLRNLIVGGIGGVAFICVRFNAPHRVVDALVLLLAFMLIAFF
jgi:hypothetical protein